MRTRSETRVWASALLVGSLAACGDGSTAMDEEQEAIDLLDATEPPELGGLPPAYTVQAGLWSYRDGGVEANTCGSYARSDGDLTFWVPYAEPDRFVVYQGEPWGDFACFVAGERFECPERLAGSEPVEGTDAVVSFAVRIEGTLASATSMTGTQHVRVTCEGSSCALAPAVLGFAFPCGWSTPFEADAR